MNVYMPGAARAPAHAEDEWLGELMDAAIARVLQAVRAQESSLNAYRVSRSLHFYALTMARMLSSRALLRVATTLKECIVPSKLLPIPIIGRTTTISYMALDANSAQGSARAHYE